MINKCQLCLNPVSKTGQLRRTKMGKQILRLCKACRFKLLEQAKTNIYYGTT